MGLFTLFVFVSGSWLLRLFYGDGYLGEEPVVQVLALALLTGGERAWVRSRGLCVLNRAEVGFTANFIGLLVTNAGHLVAAAGLGVLGAAWGFLLGNALNAGLRRSR